MYSFIHVRSIRLELGCVVVLLRAHVECVAFHWIAWGVCVVFRAGTRSGRRFKSKWEVARKVLFMQYLTPAAIGRYVSVPSALPLLPPHFLRCCCSIDFLAFFLASASLPPLPLSESA